MHDKSAAGQFRLPYFFIAEYLIFTATTALFLLHHREWTLPVALVLIPALFFYPLLYLTPALFLTAIAAWCTRNSRTPVRRISGATALVTIFFLHLLLLLDAGIYFRYSYHINPHVINIFTTPGGFEAMGLRHGEITALAVGIFILAIFHLLLFTGISRFAGRPAAKPELFKTHPVRCGIIAVIFFTIMFLTSYITYTYEHFTMNPQPLLAADAIPFYLKGTSSSLYKKLGFKPPDRQSVRMRLNKSSALGSYPQQPIIREPNRPGYNVVWIACESLAAKLTTPEIMPKMAKFAQKGVRFTNHYSGGNVTRQGMFSMFYALPGNYWHSFLAARRGPLFIDWLKEDGYRFKCISSSKFTYPEFDQTIFFQVPRQDMHSDTNGKSYARDQRNLKLLLKSIEEGADSGKPFFSFMFFESAHNPYEFPPEAAYTDDYIDPFIATGVTPADGPRIFNRAANCARHVDMCLDKVFQTLEKKDLLKNTIVVIAGDHGEEFYEHGYLGHSSSFVNEQTKTALILYYPGIKPGEYHGISSHLDIIPMLGKCFGVRNNPQDYSCGYDLLAEGGKQRRYALIADWSQIFFAGEKYKSLIPTDAVSFAKQVITDSNDRVLPDVKPFYREYSRSLIEVQNDLNRFTKPAKQRK